MQVFIAVLLSSLFSNPNLYLRVLMSCFFDGTTFVDRTNGPCHQVNIGPNFRSCQFFGEFQYRLEKAGLLIAGSWMVPVWVHGWHSTQSCQGGNPNKRKVSYRKSFQTMVHLGGQDTVRTFFEEDIKIPIYDIPLSQGLRTPQAKSQHLSICVLEGVECNKPVHCLKNLQDRDSIQGGRVS